ncbi:MAG: FGGY family carbohydrate kinase [Pseudomonadales bacterium]
MTVSSERYYLVADIGKTHIKLHLLNQQLESVQSQQMANTPIQSGLYPHADVERHWQWLLAGIKSMAAEFDIGAISVTTHGATAALINRHADDEEGLVLPILDYEFLGVEACNADYEQVRPAFDETCSPALPGGLNIGRQLFWQQQMFPNEFAKASDILMYPQYWAWRMTGECVSEVTSLGCHSDLWSPSTGGFSALPAAMGWSSLFPPVEPAWTHLGNAQPSFRAATGLSESCRVYVGVHDSNASFLRYRRLKGDKPFTVASTGTWTIVMAAGVPLGSLDASRDMLANVDVTGQPVACARFMGGREFESVCELSGAAVDEPFGDAELQQLLDKAVMVAPEFSGGSGPFGGRKGELVGSVPAGAGSALATLYCALVMDYQFDMLDSQGDLYIEGAFLKNPQLCAVLAQLRPDTSVWVSKDTTGTVQGCARLMCWDAFDGQVDVSPVRATALNGLSSYRALWRQLVAEGS